MGSGPQRHSSYEHHTNDTDTHTHGREIARFAFNLKRFVLIGQFHEIKAFLVGRNVHTHSSNGMDADCGSTFINILKSRFVASNFTQMRVQMTM